MRTIGEAHAELVKLDPSCCLTPTALRRKVVTGEIPSTRVGRKYLLDLDRLEHDLFGSTEATSTMTGVIRPVEVSR
jgi:hypothetical protein